MFTNIFITNIIFTICYCTCLVYLYLLGCIHSFITFKLSTPLLHFHFNYPIHCIQISLSFLNSKIISYLNTNSLNKKPENSFGLTPFPSPLSNYFATRISCISLENASRIFRVLQGLFLFDKLAVRCLCVCHKNERPSALTQSPVSGPRHQGIGESSTSRHIEN